MENNHKNQSEYFNIDFETGSQTKSFIKLSYSLPYQLCCYLLIVYQPFWLMGLWNVMDEVSADIFSLNTLKEQTVP